MKKVKIFIFTVGVATLSLMGVRNDFGLMQSTEMTINLMRELSQNYVDEVKPSDLLKDAAYGMTRTLDPYSAYLAEEDMQDFQIMTTGKYGGIGSIIRQKGKYVIISQPYKDSPAAKAGLKVGDRLLKIDGVDAVGMTTAEASEKLKGTPGTKLKLEIIPIDDTTSHKRVSLIREIIKIPAINYYSMVGQAADSIAYISHTDFTDGSYKDMTKALLEMKAEGMKGAILDYRNNGGGILQEAIDILSLFLPKGTEVLTIKGRRDSTVFKTSQSPLFENLPLVVLIDENSASAAEIVAGALQDLDRAVLIGQRSFGKGLVQSTIPVGFNSYLKLTTARYYIPSGRCIQAIDYSSTDQSSPHHKRADSLKREFTTRSGRKVYDGGGIAPDIVTKAEYVSRYAATLYARGIIDEFGDDYYIRNIGNEPTSLTNFQITDEEYNNFKRFIEERDIPYKSRTRKLLEDMKKAAKDERYTECTEEIAALERALKDDKLANLETYRTEIIEYINRDIITRYGYAEAVIANSLPKDREIKRAIEILKNPKEWQRSLEGHKE